MPNNIEFTLEDAEKVYIVDFSYPKDVMVKLLQQDFDLIVLDHHKTAEANLKDLALKPGSEIHFDMTRSGALMTWEYFDVSAIAKKYGGGGHAQAAGFKSVRPW